MVALLALLITWVVTSGDGGGNNDAGGSNGKNPASSITPGPSGSGPAISQHPGGRDESSGGDSSGSGAGSGAGAGTGSGGSDGSGGAGGSGGGAGSAGGPDDGINGSAGGGTGAGAALPAGSPLPNCTPSTVTLTLRSVRNSYTPDQTPTFQIVARNTSAHDCKVDLGPKSAVVTISQEGDHFWSSADCPKGGGSLLYRVPASSSITYVVPWDRRASAPQCATPPARTATPGTYLVEAKAPGFEKAQTSFVLAAD